MNPEKYPRLDAFFDFLNRKSRPTLFFIATASMLALGVLDYLTGEEISFSFFYLIPVSLGAWSINLRTAAFLSIASAATWQLANYLAGETFSHPLIPYWNSSIRLGFFLVVSILLSSLRESLVQARSLSRTDFLTGAVNLRAFYDLASGEILRCSRYGHPFTVAYFDLDNFKLVNDKHGHGTGDLVLQTVAHTIRKNIRGTDVIARLGGDEFALLLPETGYDQGGASLAKLRKLLLEEMERNNWPVTFSIGALTCTAPPPGVDEIIRLADNLMYTVKAAGKNALHHGRFPKGLNKGPAAGEQVGTC